MPSFTPKEIQQDLEKNAVWPVYWLYGAERMKSREILKRIRRKVVGHQKQSLNEEILDGPEIAAETLVESARTMAFGGGVRFIVVRDAHGIKETERLEPLLGEPSAERDYVCVFLSKDLDKRKKFSKALLKKAAVVECAEVPDSDRPDWIRFLAARRKITLSDALLAQLTMQDPWTLEIVDSELEKYAVAPPEHADQVIYGSLGAKGGVQHFLHAFFMRDQARALELLGSFARKPEEAIPLLGLLAWNVRHLALLLADQREGTRHLKINPYLADRLRAWGEKWELEEVVSLQAEIFELDRGLKQTARQSLALWTQLVNHVKATPDH